MRAKLQQKIARIWVVLFIFIPLAVAMVGSLVVLYREDRLLLPLEVFAFIAVSIWSLKVVGKLK